MPSENFSSYAILLITLVISKGPRFLWSNDLFGRVVLMFLLSSIIMSFCLNWGAGKRWRFVCSVIKIWDHLNSALKNSLSWSIFFMNLFVAIISRFALWETLISQGTGDFSSLRRIYPLVARKRAISMKTFLSEFASNSATDNRSTQLSWL